MSGVENRPASPEVASLINSLAGTATECIFYGFHIVVTTLLLLNFGSQWRQRTISLASSCVLFGLSTAMWGMGLRENLDSIRSLQPGGHFVFVGLLEWARCGLFTIAMLIGDAILTWRVFMLYRRTNIWLVVPQIIALVGAIGLGLASATCMFRASRGFNMFGDHTCNSIVILGQKICWILSCFINVSSTVLLGVVAWKHSVLIRGCGIRKNAVMNILYLLAISSTIYCLLWIPLIALVFYEYKHLGSSGPAIVVETVLQSAFQQLVGIYPTLVTFLTLQNSTIFGSRANASSGLRLPTNTDPTLSFSNGVRRTNSHPVQISIQSRVQTFEDKTISSAGRVHPIILEDIGGPDSPK